MGNIFFKPSKLIEGLSSTYFATTARTIGPFPYSSLLNLYLELSLPFVGFIIGVSS
jgi:hypothetical protein